HEHRAADLDPGVQDLFAPVGRDSRMRPAMPLEAGDAPAQVLLIEAKRLLAGSTVIDVGVESHVLALRRMVMPREGAVGARARLCPPPEHQSPAASPPLMRRMEARNLDITAPSRPNAAHRAGSGLAARPPPRAPSAGSRRRDPPEVRSPPATGAPSRAAACAPRPPMRPASGDGG